MCLIFVLILLSVLPAYSDPLRFIVLGDLPYRQDEKTLQAFDRLIATINKRQPDLVIHVGDTKSGGSPCTDERLLQERENLMRFQAPTLYTPGDNEWTDCHRQKAGSYDPLERLEFLKKTYFKGRDVTFGQRPLSIATQAHIGYPENTRLRIGNVVFITVHVVGSQNNMNDRPGSMREFIKREQANIAWLQQSFKAADDADQIVVALQANMFFLGYSYYFEHFIGRSPYGPLTNTLVKQARGFAKPVLLVHGDTHNFRAYQPFSRRAPNITAIETLGYPDIGAVEITLHPETPQPYQITPVTIRSQSGVR